MCLVGRSQKVGWALVLWGCILFKFGCMFHIVSNEILHLQFSFNMYDVTFIKL